MEHKKVNFLHSVRLKMLLAMAFFTFVTGGFACALFISSTKKEIGSVTRGYMCDLSRAYGVMLDSELDTGGDDALSGEHLASIFAGVQVEGVESSYIYVVSGDGTMLYHPTADKIGKPVENKAVSDAVAKIAKGEKVENEAVKYEFKGADKYAGIYVNDTQDFIVVVTADYDDVFSSVRKVEGKIRIIVLLELLIVATIGSAFAYIIVKPMNEISELTVKGGDMDLTGNEIQTRLANRKDEIGQLQEHFQQMQQSLASHISELEHLSTTLKDRNEVLRIAYDRAQEADMMKIAFLHHMTNQMLEPTLALEDSVKTLCNNYQELTQQEADHEVDNIQQKSHTIIEVLNSMIHGAEDEIQASGVQEGSGKGGRL